MYLLSKTQLLETEELLAASKKKTAEVLEENNRVNLCLEENKKCLQELEEVRLNCVKKSFEEPIKKKLCLCTGDLIYTDLIYALLTLRDKKNIINSI